MSKDFEVEKLRGSENYHTWKFAMCNVLALKGFSNCIVKADGVVKEKDANKLLACKAMLSLGVQPSIYIHIQDCTAAIDIWEKLQNLYEDKGLCRKVTLLRKLISTRLDSCDGMQHYVDQILCCSSKLNGIGFAISDEWIVAILLAGLTDDFKPFIMGIEASNTTANSEVIISKLLDGQQNSSNGEALWNKKFKSRKYQKDVKDLKKGCFNCGSLKHFKAECPHSKRSTTTKSQKSGEAKNAFCALLNRNSNQYWYVDSGASNHMTPFSERLQNIRPSNVDCITSANDAKMKVKHIGDSSLKIENNKEIVINDILHIPDIAVNLLSVNKIVEKGNIVTFDRAGCTITNKSKEVVVTCKAENGVYAICESDSFAMLSNQEVDDAYIWHRRLGHLSYGKMCSLKKRECGVIFNDDEVSIKNCEVCAYGKQTRKSFKNSESTTEGALELIHSDLMGPMETPSIGKARFILTFIDDFSRKVFVYFLKTKDEVMEKFIEFKKLVENQLNLRIKRIRTDNGTEYCNSRFEQYLKSYGIQHQKTAPYTPEQNGVAERMNRTLVEMAKCMLFDAELHKRFWAEAINMAAFIQNKVVKSNGRIADEVFHETKVTLSDLKIFGSPVMVHIPKPKRSKWDKKSENLVFVGYDEDTKGFRCINKKTGKLTVSRDVIFHEISNKNKLSVSNEDNIDSVGENIRSVGENIEPTKTEESSAEAESFIDSSPEPPSPVDLDYVPHQNVGEVTPTSRSTRSKTQNLQPLNLINFALFAEPSTVEEALKQDDSAEWKKAINEELESHRVNNTWELTNLPLGRNPIKAKWVFKVKEDGRYKARLVAKGCSQKYGIDYDETYSPVVRYASIRLLMALAVQRDLNIYQMDAVTAFLQGDLEEDIYMRQPEGFDDGSGRVCKLNRSIYGLKQSGRLWNIKLDQALYRFGLKRAKNDPCIYFNSKLTIFITIYVDDFLILYKNDKELNEIRKYLHETFQMKDLGVAKNCVGIEINRGKDFIELNQTKYIQKILQRFGMSDCKPVKTPCELHQKLSAEVVNEENCLVGKVAYQEAVGSLLYLTQATRPDIAFAVNNVSRYNTKHNSVHWQAVKRIFRYLRGTADLKLRYTKPTEYQLEMYSDADWGSEIDDRKSCSGFVIKLCNGAICWGSKRQPITALSSTEAEYIALSTSVREILWLKQLAGEIDEHLNGHANVYCDNQGALRLAETEAFRPRTKHIDIRYHHIRELVEKGVINIDYVSTEVMTADSLTKAVSAEKQKLCTKEMGLTTS